ncbi:alpha/beta fold hydrolase [Deinococcus alpinitundrae]|uniref:alpha/beta fold hydrolase n=1 Tax=Deinococcus alpinitundrae TaxID=468913 RepID=UPI00137A8626|nr:alpha/beta hydrolase [Deinococcus alpinitundrae]
MVIDAGWGGFSTPWHTVQSGVARRTTRVCTCDLAGMGYSEPSPLPRDASHFEGELHTLLQRAGVPGPYVMVGHSLGGLTTRIFVHRHPSEVAGVVLIESMSPEQVGTSTPVVQPTPTPAVTTHAQGFGFVSAAARLGLVRMLAGALGVAKGLPQADAGEYTALTVTPGYFQAMADEGAGIPASLAQADEVTSFGDLPLTVLTRGLDPDPVWQAKQRGLLRLSSRSTQVTATHSAHSVWLDEPQVAVDAIVNMIEQVR